MVVIHAYNADDRALLTLTTSAALSLLASCRQTLVPAFRTIRSICMVVIGYPTRSVVNYTGHVCPSIVARSLLFFLIAYTDMALTSLLATAIGLGAVVLTISCVVAYLSSPLKAIPGPFLARFSNIWRFYNHYGQTHIETQKELHKKYGDVVRLGPNTVSIADAELLKTIYSTRGTFLKVCITMTTTHSKALTIG